MSALHPATMVVHRQSLFVYFFFLLIPLLDAFPDHLQGPVGCSTELATDEVIMNARVTAYADSRDPAVRIAVQQQEAAAVGDDKSSSPIIVSSVPMTVHLVVQNPNRLGDLQYVVDVMTTTTDENGATSATPTTAASFEHGVCDNKKRVTGRAGDVHTLIIEKIPETPLQVWAGWACSHETVTLTNYLVFTKGGEDKVKQDNKDNNDAVKEMVDQVLDLEQADQNERKDLQAELGDDDAANEGDLEEQLDQMHADKDVREHLEQIFKDRAQWHEKTEDVQQRLPHQDLDKYRDLIQEKKMHGPGGGAAAVRDDKLHAFHDWDQVKKRLALQGKFIGGSGGLPGAVDHSKLSEHQRLMQEHRDRIYRDNPMASDHKLKDLDHRSDLWKQRLQERRAAILATQKEKAPLPKDMEDNEEEVLVVADPEHRGTREIYEEQDSDIALKELLIGLLGILTVNWLILQICLWNDKRQKGRRNL